MGLAECAPASAPALGASFRSILIAYEEIAVLAAADADLDTILRTVGKRLCEIIGVNRCSVYLKGEDGLLHGRVGWWAAGDIDQEVRSLVAGFETDGFTQEILATRKAVLIRNAALDDRAVRSTMRRWGVRDMLGVPLLVAGEAIGVIYVDNEDKHHRYLPGQIQMAEMFASLAAYVIRQADLYGQLRERASLIERQRRVLTQMSESQRRVTRAVANGSDIVAILDLVTELVGKPAVLYTRTLAPVRWSGLLAHLPSLELAAGFGRNSRVREAVSTLSPQRTTVVLPALPELGQPCRQLLCRLLANGEMVGYLGVFELGQEITQLDARLVEHAGTLLALELSANERELSARGIMPSDFIGDLLDSSRDRGLVHRRAVLAGLDDSRNHVVVRLVSAGIGDRGSLEELWARVVDSVQAPESLFTASNIGFTLVVPLRGKAISTGLKGLEHELALLLSGSAAGLDASIIVSGICRTLDDYPAARRDLEEVERLCTALSIRGRVLMTADLGVLRLAIQRDSGAAHSFARRFLGPLICPNARVGAELLETLRVYLRSSGQVRSTARALNVHENTVRYRLARIEELTSIRTGDLDTLLNAQFAIRLLELIGELRALPYGEPEDDASGHMSQRQIESAERHNAASLDQR